MVVHTFMSHIHIATRTQKQQSFPVLVWYRFLRRYVGNTWLSAMLLRRYIGQHLQAYYAQAEDAVVGGLSPLQLSSLWGKWHWLTVYQRLYRKTRGQWLIPVELFQPYYSQVIANYTIQSCDQSEGPIPIEIHEIGSGRGTNARALLKNHAGMQSLTWDTHSSREVIDDSSGAYESNSSGLARRSGMVWYQWYHHSSVMCMVMVVPPVTTTQC
jgi:hypothetical protein